MRKEKARMSPEQKGAAVELLVVAALGIIGITVIILYSLSKGVDGQLVALGIGMIGVIVGGVGTFKVPKIFGK
jgi:hypothetical protein